MFKERDAAFLGRRKSIKVQMSIQSEITTGHRRPDPVQTIRIALVDDDQSVHLAIRQIFKVRASDWTLDSYLDGHHALENIPRALPQAVLMDISMPGITGIDCTKK